LLASPRTRRARAAALSLALAAPIVASTAAPAFASGESTSALLTSPSPTTGSASTFTWSYTFDQGTGHGLSNVAIGFCSAGVLADVVSAGPSGEIFTSGDVPGGHTGFGPGVKFAVTATTGALSVTFAHPHAISAGSLRVQSHSGDGRTGDTITTAAGPACATDEGGSQGSGTNDPGTTNNDPGTTNNDNGNANANGDPTGGGNQSAGGTQTSGGGQTQTSGGGETADPAPSPSTPSPSITGDPAPATVVLSETLVTTVEPAPAAPAPASSVVQSGELARTGAGDVGSRLELGFGLLAAGLALRAAFGRRFRSTSSAG
jgi:hypothetical protein